MDLQDKMINVLGAFVNKYKKPGSHDGMCYMIDGFIWLLSEETFGYLKEKILILEYYFKLTFFEKAIPDLYKHFEVNDLAQCHFT